MTHHEIYPNDAVRVPGLADDRRAGEDELRLRGARRPINLENALGYSCDTFFYVPAANEYYADQARIAQRPEAARVPAAHGGGVRRRHARRGVDLPADEQASRLATPTARPGWRGGRRTRTPTAPTAQRGYPDVTNPTQRAYLTQLASENCTDGWRYRAGDNADMAIGQGETTMSPLQLAIAYSALVNGGSIWQPDARLGASSTARARSCATITPEGAQHGAGEARRTLDYIAQLAELRPRLGGVGRVRLHRLAVRDRASAARPAPPRCTASRTRRGWRPGGRSTTQHGHVRARFVVVGMVEQGGTGATAAGPMLKRDLGRHLRRRRTEADHQGPAPGDDAAEDRAAGEGAAVSRAR